MTDQRRTSSGYRGALPPRNDRLARPWVAIVIAIFLLIMVLAIAGLPSRLIPDPTPTPRPSIVVLPSADSSADPSADSSASAEASAAPSAEPSASGDIVSPAPES
jgi:hypothetical protein